MNRDDTGRPGPGGPEIRELAMGFPHSPLCPLWICRVDAQEWPCGPARYELSRWYRDDRTGLRMFMAELQTVALEDLWRLYGGDPPTTPQALYDRFVGWARRWRGPEPVSGG